MRGDRSFCRYWRNCWPSLFKLSFHITYVFVVHFVVVLHFPS
jgi:hypothetical protein